MDITTVAGRRSLEVRREPYWRAEGGAYLGFRCTGQNGIGAWIGRVGDGSKQHYQALGKFGDYREAAKALNAWLDQRQTNKSTGIANDSLTVVDACRIYLEWARMTKGEGRAIACPTNILEASVTVRASGKRKKEIAPHRIAAIRPADLTKPDIKAWRDGLIDGPEVDAPRAKRSTASRHFKQFIAVLNHAHREQLVASNMAWSGVPDFSNYVATARESHRYLTPEERLRLLDAADPAVCDFLALMALTGARPIELQRLTVADYDTHAHELKLWRYKGKSRAKRVRHVPVDSLPGVGAVVKRVVKGKLPAAPMFSQAQEFWIIPVKHAARAAGLSHPLGRRLDLDFQPRIRLRSR